MTPQEMGRKGGLARALKLSKRKRKAAALHAANVRWSRAAKNGKAATK